MGYRTPTTTGNGMRKGRTLAGIEGARSLPTLLLSQSGIDPRGEPPEEGAFASTLAERQPRKLVAVKS